VPRFLFNLRVAPAFLLLALLALVPPAATSGCAGTECNFSSQCDRMHYCFDGTCYQDCQRDFDCPGTDQCSSTGECVPEGTIDSGTPPSDSGVPPSDTGTPPTDTGTPPIDTGTPPMDTGTPPTDTGTPPIDTGTPPMDTGTTPGTGRYLDRCNVGGDCASTLCVDDIGSSRMCSRACTLDSDCASEHVCGLAGVCMPDDTGTPCSTATPASCSTGLCIGPAGSTGSCTKACSGAATCPAGYACTDIGGTHVCVDIEKSCGVATDCATGLCIPGLGCTAECRGVVDCPGRLPGLPPYTCEVARGATVPICNPPFDIAGDDPIGSICPVVGPVQCRSGACNTSAPVAPMCTQSCTIVGGCGPGLGCRPEIEGPDLFLVCARAGNGALGAGCSTAAECASALCDATANVCTRFCADALCPTGWTCTPVPGFSIALCRP